ncbi:MAG: TetR/AcrR family transcriptional regulator [Pseudomonadales bacterium]|nr:TetR/AcrR family transcriptional regulator [Pseudomonadales bacterium]
MTTKRIPNEERRAASTEAVLNAARQLFVAHGYEYTSMSQIARAAGLTKGAIYFYFKDKAQLLDRLLDESERTSFNPIIDTVTESPASPTERLVLFVNAVAQLGVDHRDQLLLPVLMAVEFSASDNEAASRLQTIYARWTAMLETVIVEGQSQGEFDPSLDAPNTAITLVALVDGLLLQWHRLHNTLDGPLLANTARKIVLNALTI